MVYDWGRPHRIQAIALSSNGSLLVATDTENHLHVYNFITRELEYEMDFKVRLTSVSFTKDSNYILISKIDGEIRLFSVEDRKSIRTFAGQKPGKFVIRSVFGGADESFVISGSDGKILSD
jgi:WD40 repeat protein